MKKLKTEIALWLDNGMFAEVVDAPAGAATFDKMLVVFRDEKRRCIILLMFYNSVTDKFTGKF